MKRRLAVSGTGHLEIGFAVGAPYWGCAARSASSQGLTPIKTRLLTINKNREQRHKRHPSLRLMVAKNMRERTTRLAATTRTCACAGSVALLLLLSVTAACRNHGAGRTDVVLITVDTLRRDHVSVYAPDSPAKTPAIDALAADGIRFTQAWSPISVTAPAFCTVMTGRDPGGHGVVMNLFQGGRPLTEHVPTLAKDLRARGYATAAFVSSFTLARTLNLDSGFQVYEEPASNFGRIRGNQTTSRALKWLEDQDGPVFLWVHLYDPHGPLDQWKEVRADDPDWLRGGPNLERIPVYQRIGNIADSAFYAKLYSRAVAFADVQVGRLVQGLHNNGRYDKALIVFLADHGESFTERELWFDHGTTPFAEQLQIPLLLKLPQGQRAGTSDNRLVGLADVAPTVTGGLGLEKLAGTEGSSLLDSQGRIILTGESSHCKKESLLSCHPKGPGGKILAARDTRWTLVFEPTARGPRWSLYDRNTDPQEMTPLQGGGASEPLRNAINAVRNEREALKLNEPIKGSPGDVNPSTLEVLRSLGYAE